MTSTSNTISRRRLLAGTLAAAGSTTILSGCGTPSDTSNTGAGQGDAETGVLNVWGALTLDKGVGDFLDAFKKKYPNIKVTYHQFTNNTDGNLKLDTSLQGGAPIDVFFSYGASAVSRRTKAGYAKDLTDLANGEDSLKQFTATDPQKTALFDGKLYAIPTVYNPYMVYLNQEMLDKASITVPDDWTVQEFHEIGKELVAGGYADTATYKSLPTATMALGGDAQFANNGKSSNFDNPLWKDQYQLEEAMEKDGTLFSIKQVLAQKVDLYAQSFFLAGKHAFYLDNPATLRFVKDTENYPHTFKTTFRPMPYLQRGKQQWNPGAYADCIQIGAKTQYPDAAWTFAKFWLGDGAKYLLTAGKIPPARVPTTAAQADALLPGLLGDDREKLFDLDAFKKVAFAKDMKLCVTTITTALSEIGTVRRQLDQQMRLGKISVHQMMTELKKQADAAITKALKQDS